MNGVLVPGGTTSSSPAFQRRGRVGPIQSRRDAGVWTFFRRSRATCWLLCRKLSRKLCRSGNRRRIEYGFSRCVFRATGSVRGL